jgi:hypothetical protein
MPIHHSEIYLREVNKNLMLPSPGAKWRHVRICNAAFLPSRFVTRPASRTVARTPGYVRHLALVGANGSAGD